MANKFSWDAPALAPEDKRLVSVYEKIGRPLDLLPYTKEFDTLLQQLDMKTDRAIPDQEKANVFHRLLALRKMARLPRTSSVIDVSGEGLPLSGEDQELISAYERVGRSLDSLPYTEDLDTLLAELGKPKTDAIKHAVFQRLLRLRKRGRLPRVSDVD